MAFRKVLLKALITLMIDVGAAGCSGDSEWFRILANNMNIHYNQGPTSIMNIERISNNYTNSFFGYMRGHSASVLIQHHQKKKIGYKKILVF
jgi:hypothetical protein